MVGVSLYKTQSHRAMNRPVQHQLRGTILPIGQGEEVGDGVCVCVGGGGGGGGEGEKQGHILEAICNLIM